MQQPIRRLTCGYATVLVAIALLAFFANHTRSDGSYAANANVIQQLMKNKLLLQLSTNAQMRTNLIRSSIQANDDLTQHAFSSAYTRTTHSYNDTRLELSPLLTPSDMALITEIDRYNQSISNFDQQIIYFIFDGSLVEAKNILDNEILPRTKELLGMLSEVKKAISYEELKQLQHKVDQSEVNQGVVSTIAIVTFLAYLLVILLSIYYFRKESSKIQDVAGYLEEKVLEATESLLDTQKELIEDNTLLARLASTDSLTGLYNRSQITTVLNKEHSRFIRHNQPFGIIMLDIDHFKEINDNYGHDAGDKALKLLSRLLEETVRQSDYAARWGGDEFMIVCTTINNDDLLPIAEDIRHRVCEIDLRNANMLTVTLGCAIIQPNESIIELIKRADVALYAAKNNGRNQTIVSEFAILT
ncbi:MAG: diguanylate cyclase (GGDEF)-like protein [Gammaproteobacteria bacterium]|jgi:diguanylate cyclase (GGDEF)-like protein